MKLIHGSHLALFQNQNNTEFLFEMRLKNKTGKKGYWFKFPIDRQLNSQFSYPDYD